MTLFPVDPSALITRGAPWSRARPGPPRPHLQVAPKTVEHIFKLCVLGGYQSNHFFRVDKGFVAQTAAPSR